MLPIGLLGQINQYHNRTYHDDDHRDYRQEFPINFKTSDFVNTEELNFAVEAGYDYKKIERKGGNIRYISAFFHLKLDPAVEQSLSEEKREKIKNLEEWKKTQLQLDLANAAYPYMYPEIVVGFLRASVQELKTNTDFNLQLTDYQKGLIDELNNWKEQPIDKNRISDIGYYAQFGIGAPFLGSKLRKDAKASMPILDLVIGVKVKRWHFNIDTYIYSIKLKEPKKITSPWDSNPFNDPFFNHFNNSHSTTFDSFNKNRSESVFGATLSCGIAIVENNTFSLVPHLGINYQVPSSFTTEHGDAKFSPDFKLRANFSVSNTYRKLPFYNRSTRSSFDMGVYMGITSLKVHSYPSVSLFTLGATFSWNTNFYGKK